MASGKLSYSEAVVLLLIHQGVSSAKGIAGAMHLPVEEVEVILRGLEAKGLITRERAGILRRERLRLTRAGYDAIPEATTIAMKVSRRATEAAERARSGGERPEFEPEILAILPALAFLGLLPAWALALLLPLPYIDASTHTDPLDEFDPDAELLEGFEGEF